MSSLGDLNSEGSMVLKMAGEVYILIGLSHGHAWSVHFHCQQLRPPDMVRVP